MTKTLSSAQAIFYACLVLVVGLLSIDLYNPSLPAIVTNLHISPAIAKSLVVTYLIGFAFSQLIYGPKSDHHGRKKILIISLSLTVLGNFLTTFAHSGSELLVYRFITGLGAGGCPVISRAILRDTFSDKQSLTHAFSIFAMSSQISPAFAPIVGGVIEHFFNWRYNFIALAVITFLALILVISGYLETNQNTHQPQNKKLFSNYMTLLCNPYFLTLGLLSGLVFSYTIGYYTINPFVYQNQFHLNAYQNGFIYIFYAMGIVLGSYTTKKLTKKFTPEKVLLTSLISLCCLTILMTATNYIWPNLYLLIAESFLLATLCGLSAPILISLCILPFPEMAGSASALQGMLKMLTTAVTLVLLAFYKVTTALHLAIVMLIISGVVTVLMGCLIKQIRSDKN